MQESYENLLHEKFAEDSNRAVFSANFLHKNSLHEIYSNEHKANYGKCYVCLL